MKLNRRNLRRMIKEELSAQDKFTQSMDDDYDNRAQHLDDLLARQSGYEDHYAREEEDAIAYYTKAADDVDRLDQMTRDEVGMSGTYHPSESVKFLEYQLAAEKALDRGDRPEFEKNYTMMSMIGSNIDTSDSDAWKTMHGVDRLVREMEGQNSFFNIKRSPVLKSLGIVENKNIVRFSFEKFLKIK